MADPKRIQRLRTKGWTAPLGARYVGRPSIFGNPYWDIKRYGLDLCLRMFEETARGCWDASPIIAASRNPVMTEMWIKWMYEDHQAWLKRIGHHPVETIRIGLRGRDLMCWCPLSQPCHADILLKIANDG